MAILAKSNLNPEAPEFKPNKIKIFYFCYPLTPPFIHHYLQAPPPIHSPEDPSFYYTQPMPQHHDHLVISEPAPPVTEPAPSLAVSEEPHVVHEPKVEPEVVAQKGNQGGVKRGCRNSYFGSRNGGGREGYQWRQCNGNRQARRGEAGRYPRKGQSWVWSSKKHEVLPVNPDGHSTTVMIKNIPNRYTRQLLLEFLDDHCMVENQKAKAQNSDAVTEPIVSAFDFLYLPIDFKSRMNKGYAFVNFTDPRAVWKFHLATHNQAWPIFQSNKRCQMAYARLQGKEELEKHFNRMWFPCEEYQPYIL